MKFVGCVAVFSLVFNLSTQIPEFHNCPPEIMTMYQDACGVVTCHGNTDVSHERCATCEEDKQLAYILGDNSKPYPDCCGRPVCAE